MSPTISYVWTYDIVCPVLDVVYHIVYTISYIRYCIVGHTISYVRYRMFLRYRMSTCDVVCMTYDIVLHNESSTYTISYVCKYMRYRMSVMYDIVCAYRIPYRMSCTISYVDIRYRIWRTISYVNLVVVCFIRHLTLIYDVVHYTYDIVCLFWRHLQLTLNSQKTPIQCVCIWPSGFLDLAPFLGPCIQCWHVRNTVIFYIKNGYCHTPIRLPCNQWTVQTPSLGVREPRCTVPVAVGCFYPDIQGAQVGGLTSAMVLPPWTVLSSSPV